MNDKLKKWTFAQVAPSACGSRGGGVIDQLVTVSVGNKDAGSLNFSFHQKLAKLAGWIEGDCLTMEYDNGMVCIYRGKPGRLLSGSAGNHCTRKRVRFKVPIELAELFRNKVATEVEVDGGRVAFMLQD